MLVFDWISLVLGVSSIGLGTWLLIRFADSDRENIHYFYTVLLALGGGFLGAFFPGVLDVEGDIAGIAIRAGSGMAVFVIILVLFYLLRTRKVIARIRSR